MKTEVLAMRTLPSSRQSVKADSELFKGLTISCNKQETRTMHALFKLN